MDADFYTMRYFDKKFNNKNFFEIQRLAYPFLTGAVACDNEVIYTLLSNYDDRLKNKDRNSIEKLLDSFISENNNSIINNKKFEKSLKKLSYNDLIYLTDLIDVAIYKGNYSKVKEKASFNYYGTKVETDIITEDGLPYVHFEYDKLMHDLLTMITLEKNYRFSQSILDRCGFYDLGEFSYDDYVKLMTSMAIKYNSDLDSRNLKKTDYARLFNSVSEIVNIYDDYPIDLNLNNIDVRKLSLEKLTELNSILTISSNLLKYGDRDLSFSAFMFIRNSDVVIDVQRLDEAISICENNDLETINKFKVTVMEEISNRRDKKISFDELFVNITNESSLVDESKILKK